MMMNVLLTLSSIMFPLITLPYVTRILGPEGLGRVFSSASVIAFFSIFAELGIPVYGIRACARVRNDRKALTQTAYEILIINSLSCLAVYAVLAICLLVVPRFAEDRILILIMSSSIILNAVGAEWLYKALEKYQYITVRSVIFMTLETAAVFALIHASSDYVIYGFLTISAAAASNIVNLLNLHKYIDNRTGSRPVLRKHLPGMMTLFALAAATTIYTNLDLVLLDFMKGNVEAGYYGVSVKIKLVMVNLITSVSAVLLPRISYMAGSGDQEIYSLLRKTMGGIIAVSVPAACFFTAFADKCIMVIAGSGFAGSVLPMRILMPAIVLIGISNVTGMHLLVPTGREKAVTRAAWIGAVSDLALNAVLIPRYASAGAASATLTAELLVMICLLKSAGPDAGRIVPVRFILYVTIASAIALPAGLMIKHIISGDIVMLLTAAVCFFVVYCVVMLILRKMLQTDKRK